MEFTSLDPATEILLARYPALDGDALEAALAETDAASRAWRKFSIQDRGRLLRRVGELLLERRDALALLITTEMGKPIREARAEIEKCAHACEFYAGHAGDLLRDQPIRTEARRSFVSYQPLGTVLAVMPWNFPFWQVFRFAVPALLAGNCALVKHAPIVPQCAAAIEKLGRDAGFPTGVLRWLPIEHYQTEEVINDRRIHAVTLTGSPRAGRRIAALAGAALKKTVLELGGSDPFIVLADADLEACVATAVASRFQNSGQSCIAAKRFIVVEAIADNFIEAFRAAIQALEVGDPKQESTRIGPLARADLRDGLHEQVSASLQAGARRLAGGAPRAGTGWFYEPTLLDRVKPGMPVHDEEVFGPAAAVLRVADEEEAIGAANRHRFGLGGTVWTRDLDRGERIARQLECGVAFVNGMVKSDPRMPFGGVKDSGYGRELGHEGLLEFCNIKSVWVD